MKTSLNYFFGKSPLTGTLKAIFISFWAILFLYPAFWHIMISDQVYRNMVVWRHDFGSVFTHILPFVDLKHRIYFPIHNAALKGKFAIIKSNPLGISSLNALDSYKLTPLCYSIYNKDVDGVNLLLEMGSNANIRIARQMTPLTVAAQLRLEKIAVALLENGATTDHIDVSGRAPIHYIIEMRLEKVLAKALSLGHSPSCKDGHGLTPLDYAIRADSLTMVGELALNGAPIKFSATPKSNYISNFLARWQQFKDPRRAIIAEDDWQRHELSKSAPAELPPGVSPKTFNDQKGNR